MPPKVGDTVEILDATGSGHNDHDIGTVVSYDGIHFWVDVKGFEQCHSAHHLKIINSGVQSEITPDNPPKLMDVIKNKDTDEVLITVSHRREQRFYLLVINTPNKYIEISDKDFPSLERLYNLKDVHKELNI